MRGLLGHATIRLQLLGLFVLWIAAGATVLGLDEWNRRHHQRMLRQLSEETLVSLRRIHAVSDAYGLDDVNTVFRVANNGLDWSDGLAAIDASTRRAANEWRELENLPHAPDERAAMKGIADARVRADATVGRLRMILRSRNSVALEHFAGTELFPAFDPLTARLQQLGTLVLEHGEQQVRDENERMLRLGKWRVALSLLALAAAAWFGSLVLRNIYRGVESLIALTEKMRDHDYAAQPHYRPEGELGRVMDGFLAMRDDVRDSEAQQADLLRRNEQVRATLARSEEFQRSLFAAAQVAVMSIDLGGRFSSFNPYAEHLSGYAAAEMVGQRNVSRLLLQSELRDVREHLAEVVGEPLHTDARLIPALIELGLQAQEWTLVRKDGVRVPVLLATSAMHDERNEVIGYLAVATDLTRIKQLEEALRASELEARGANKSKGEFLAAMSHEIRTPLIGVTGMLEVLSHSALDPDQRRTVHVIQHSAQTLLHIIGDILDFSKVEAGRLELAPATISLPQLLRSTLENFSGAASSKGIVLDHAIDPRLGPAHVADPLRLRQVLSNFLSNALKFTEQGSVHAALEWIAAEGDGERVRFRIVDTGIGVTPEQQARLFQPFSQAETSTTRRFGGTGLGLVICERLAELMGGTIAMESTPGEGTTLTLTLLLPLGDAAEIEAGADAQPPGMTFEPRATPAVHQAEADRSLILLVDDHPTNRLVVARQLALAGYACETAEDGVQGLERWRSGRYALVLSDVHMPRMDGYRMTRALREEEARDGRPRTPVIALTAAALKDEAERCLAAGMDDYLAKPVTIPQLAACVAHWLPHAQAAVAAPPQPVMAATEPAQPATDASSGQPRVAAAAASMPLPTPVAEPSADDASPMQHAADAASAHAAPPGPRDATRADDAGILDASVLDMLTGGDPEQRRFVLDDYLKTTLGDLAAAKAARAANDDGRLAREIHKIKGAALLVGATELAGSAGTYERAARAGDRAALAALEEELAAAVGRLQAFIGHGAS